LPVSATEWAASASSELEPVTNAAAALAMAISRLMPSATSTVARLSPATASVFYVNSSGHTPFKWAGSDSLMADGFLDSANLDDTEYLLWFPHLSHTEIRKVFATCDGPTGQRRQGACLLRAPPEWERHHHSEADIGFGRQV